MPGTALELAEGPWGPIEPAKKVIVSKRHPRLAATDNSSRFPVAGSWSNRLRLPGNQWKLRILPRRAPSSDRSRRRQEEWLPEKLTGHRQLRSDGQEA